MKKKWDPGCGEFRSGLRLCVYGRVWFSEFFWGALVESNLLCIFDCWLDHVDYFVVPFAGVSTAASFMYAYPDVPLEHVWPCFF